VRRARVERRRAARDLIEVGDDVEGTFLGTLFRAARLGGVSPWVGLSHAQRLYERLLDGGGGLCVVRLGPKEARMEIAGLPLARIAYFRNGCAAFCSQGFACSRCAGTSTRCADDDVDGFAVRLQWV